MADNDSDAGYSNAKNLLKNANPDKAAQVAASFGGPSPDDVKAAKLAAMKRRMGTATD